MSNIKRVSSSAISLLVIQICNVLLPFVLVPYLTRVMGIERYGLIAFGLAFIQLSCVVVDYGFSLSAVYRISNNIENKNEIRKIVSSVYICKIIIFLPVSIFIFTFPFIFNKYGEYYSFFWILTIPVFFQSMQPTWLFHGLEKMKNITYYTVISRLIFIFSILILIKDKEQILEFMLLNGLSQLIAVIISFYLIYKMRLLPTWPGIYYIKNIFNESTEYFWSRLAVVLYGAGASFYLGAFSSTVQVALYSIAEQFYRGALAIVNPVAQALYPFMAKTKNIDFYKKIFYPMMILSVIGSGLGLIVGEDLIRILFGIEYIKSYIVFCIFMICLLVAIPSILLGYPLLGAMGDSRSANRSVMLAGIAQVFGLFILYYLNLNSAFNVVITVFISELTVLVYRSLFSIKFLKS